MNDSERPTPDRVWQSILGKEEERMDIPFTPDQLFAMARSREREDLWGRRLWLLLLIGLAAAFAYNTISVHQQWTRLSQGWMLAWTGLLLWKSRRGPSRMRATESCASFLRRQFEAKRGGFLAVRSYLFLMIPGLVASWWGGGGAAIRMSRLQAMGVDRSSWLYAFATGPWPFIVTGFLLVLVWLAFGLAAQKATRELEELERRTGE